MRPSGRAADQLRSVRFITDFTKHAEGSVLAEFGDTRVLCTASVENRVPVWLRGGGKGWVTGEYSMLPRATHTRGARERAGDFLGGDEPLLDAHEDVLTLAARRIQRQLFDAKVFGFCANTRHRH